MAKQEDGYDYEWEAVRKISDSLELHCNFHLDTFPAILRRSDYSDRILISGPELVKLMHEIADRFNMKVVKK